MTRPIGVLVVDDEAPARRRLAELLAEHDDLAVVGECDSGLAAVEHIRADPPELVLLDVQMPGLDGFGVVQEVGAAHMPAVVFVTAFDEYAVRAFEVHALDYLLKPFDRERFALSMERAREAVARRREDALEERLATLLRSRARPDAPTERLIVRARGRVVFLRPLDVEWIEAAGNYVRLHTADDEYLVRETLKGILERLAPHPFLRIHRSFLANAGAIRELVPGDGETFEVVMESGARLRSSRQYRPELQRLLE